MTTDKLKSYCNRLVSLAQDELELIDKYFTGKIIKKGSYLLEEGEICDFIAFVSSGIIRHFHTKDGVEKTCDISFENTFITDFPSFSNQVPCIYSLQALQDTEVWIIKKDNLFRLYNECSKYETIGRLMAELVAQRATEIAMSLSSEKPEERYLNLLKKHPDLFQRVQQKYIASLLGISPESLSRIRKRVVTTRRS